jgi:hypothetical protein
MLDRLVDNKNPGTNSGSSGEYADSQSELSIFLDDEIFNDSSNSIATIASSDADLAVSVVERLFEKLNGQDDIDQETVIESLALIITSNENIATQEIHDKLVYQSKDQQNIENKYTMAILAFMIERNPQIINSAEHLILDMSDDEDSSQRLLAIKLIQKMVNAYAMSPTDSLVNVLIKRLGDDNTDVRSIAADTLPIIYARQILHSEMTTNTLALKLIHPLKALERPVAARSLFLVALQDSLQQDEIEDLLNAMLINSEPHARIAINQALVMLRVAKLEQESLAGRKINSAIIDYMNVLHATGYESQRFYDDDVSWATDKALARIDQIVSEDMKY